MSDTPTPTASTLAERLIRNFNTAPMEAWSREPLYAARGAHLSAGTAARKMGASVDIIPPGQQTCPYHFHHAQEEMFIILEGHATLRVAGERLPIGPGDVIFIPPGPEYPHHIVNTGTEPLKYIGLSTKEYPEVCEYPDSGKLMAFSWKDGQNTVRSIHRKAESLDYWDGEA